MDAITNENDLIQTLFKFELHANVYMRAELELFMCESCYCEYEQPEVVTMPDCGHELCSECFKAYLEMRVQQGAECMLAKCPNQKCENIVPDTIFKQLLEPNLWQKYDRYCFESYVNLSKLHKWCPGKKCQQVIEVKAAKQIDCFCECGENFCFACLKIAHTPITCELLQTWFDRIGGDQEADTNNWLKINTKPCP
jgi:hypothetical protein